MCILNFEKKSIHYFLSGNSVQYFIVKSFFFVSAKHLQTFSTVCDDVGHHGEITCVGGSMLLLVTLLMFTISTITGQLVPNILELMTTLIGALLMITSGSLAVSYLSSDYSDYLEYSDQLYYSNHLDYLNHSDHSDYWDQLDFLDQLDYSNHSDYLDYLDSYEPTPRGYRNNPLPCRLHPQCQETQKRKQEQ